MGEEMNVDGPRSGQTGIEPFGITIEQHGHRSVVRVTGELDVFTASALRTALDDLVVDGSADVVIDLSELGFIDSSGLGVLVRTQKRTRVLRGSFALVCGDGPARRLLDLTGLVHVLRVVDSLDSLNPPLDPPLGAGGPSPAT